MKVSSKVRLGLPSCLRIDCVVKVVGLCIRCVSFVNFFHLSCAPICCWSFFITYVIFIFQTAYLYLEGCFKLMEMFEKSNSGKWKNEAKEKEILEMFRHAFSSILYFRFCFSFLKF